MDTVNHQYESELQQWRYGSKPAPCTCVVCHCVYGARGVVSPHLGGSRPYEVKPVGTPLRNAMPRKPGPAGPTLDWRKITDEFKKPKEFPTIVGPIRFAPDDADLRSNEVVRREAQYVAYHEIGNHPEKPKPPILACDLALSKEDQRFGKYASEITEQIVKSFEMTPAELGIAERTPEQRREKHTNDVIELYKNGLISVDEAARYLGNRPSPDAIFVSPKDAEWIMKLYKPTSNTKENPMSISNSTNPVTDLADRARELAKDGSVRLDYIKGAIDEGKAERKQRIEKALSGAVELDMLKGPQGKQFVLKHVYRNEAYTVYGIAYPGYGASKEAEEDMNADTVFLQGDTSPLVTDSYRTMRRLHKHLDDCDSPYVLKFYE